MKVLGRKRRYTKMSPRVFNASFRDNKNWSRKFSMKERQSPMLPENSGLNIPQQERLSTNTDKF